MDAAEHGDVAKQELHWWHEASRGWVTYSHDDGAWTGWGGENLCDDVHLPEAPTSAVSRHKLWDKDLDASSVPFFRWFAGGLTNACFNEVRVHCFDLAYE